MGVCTKELKGVTAAVLMVTPCTKSLGGVDVGPERRSPGYHDNCLALESVEESSAAVNKPRGVWLSMSYNDDDDQCLLLYRRETKARREDGEYGRWDEEAG